MNTGKTLTLGFLAAWLQFSPPASHGENFFLAPDGNDLNPGSEASPFATLERARAAARQSQDATVILAPGSYRLTNTFALDEHDSGTTYRGQNARITGSVDIPAGAVKTVTDPATLDRLLPAVRGKVLEIDLRALGITNFGEIGPRGFRRPYIPAPLELFVDDQPLMLARWPNPGQPGVPISRVLDKGSVTRNGEKPTRGGTFALETDRPARWRQSDDVWITGFFYFGYADDTVKVKSLDLQKKTLTTLQPHMYGFTNGQPWNTWVALNLLEEIDEPGEFVADKHSGKLFFLPPAGKDIAKCRLEVSVVKDPLIAIEGATNVVFDGISIECSRGMGVYIERGAKNQIKNATLRNLGMVAVCIGRGIAADPDDRHSFTGLPVSRAIGSWHEHLYENPLYDRLAGTGQGVVNCTIYNIGAGAISMGGGDRANLTAGGNYVENCEIHDFNRWDRTYKAAVNIDGVGNRIRHCLIYNCPGSAIYLHGNDQLIEFNEVHHAMMEGDDHGAFYMGRDPTERGNIIRYNYWHDIAPTNNTYCLYFDDSGGDGSLVYGNIFQRAGYFATININNGSDIVMTNNVFINCRKPVRMGVGGGMWRTKDGRFEHLLKTVNYGQPPWSSRYPELLQYLAARPQMPRGNLFAENLLVKTQPPKADSVTLKNNRPVDADPTMKYSAIPGFMPIPFDQMGIQNTVTIPK